MLNRQIIEYFLYPRFFNSISVLYKGTYFVSFKLYHQTKSKTTTYAYPFPTSVLISSQKQQKYEPPSTHLDSNFSYQTQRYILFLCSIYIIYEEERKRLNSHVVFRLQYELQKEYTTYLSCKLMKKQAATTKDESKFCVKKQSEIKYQTIDTQILEIKKGNINQYEKVTFRASEFFSTVDFYLSTFNYGFKLYRNKMQLSNILTASDLTKEKPVNILNHSLQSSSSKSQKQKKTELQRLSKLCDASLTQTFYIELQSMLEEYDRWLKICRLLQSKIENSIQRSLKIEDHLKDLSYIRMQKPVTFQNLTIHYETDRPEEILACILEDKELIRKNIRMLRIFFSELIVIIPDKMFTEQVMRNVEERKAIEEKYFIRHIQKLNPMQEVIADRRSHAVFQSRRDLLIINEKMKSCPYLLVQNHSTFPKQNTYLTYSLTVFVHGYQGNSFDFRKASNYLKNTNQYTHVLIIESITGDMNQSIEILGQAVASQVIKYIDSTQTSFTRINFVGFSLGGIIARSAFQYLDRYKRKFGIFITLSSPHLGISGCENRWVNLGVWYLIKVDKVANLKQLTLQSVEMDDSLLMKLSQCDYISHFQKVVLVCSKDDGFVPFYSTVLEESFCDQRIRILCENMKRNIRKMERVQVVFDVAQAGTLDKLTGRKGHIQFLDNDYFLELFFKLYGSQL